MQELSGGAPPPADGEEPRRIEGGPDGFDQDRRDSYGADRDRDQRRDDRDLKPWQRGPPTGPAPWQRPRDERPRDDFRPRGEHGSAAPWAQGGRGGGNDGYGYGSHGAAAPYGGGAPGAAAPWQNQTVPPPPPPGDQASYGYGGYQPFPPQHNMGAPPGLSGPPPGMAAPPMYQGYGASPPPPPPPPGDGPPPPVSFPYPNIFRNRTDILTLI